jgi:hypothetical protein
VAAVDGGKSFFAFPAAIDLVTSALSLGGYTSPRRLM